MPETVPAVEATVGVVRRKRGDSASSVVSHGPNVELLLTES